MQQLLYDLDDTALFDRHPNGALAARLPNAAPLDVSQTDDESLRLAVVALHGRESDVVILEDDPAMIRLDYLDVLERTHLTALLAAYDPHIAGTPPLGLDLPSSDIDVLCHVTDSEVFAETLWSLFGDFEGFSIRQWTCDGRPVVCSFVAFGWTFEVFGHVLPVQEQSGWRHFQVERRLLKIGGAAFRTSVMACRTRGMKTEPAVAEVLGLSRDPYEALLLLERQLDGALHELLVRCLRPD